jgi:hypothetical protein
MYNRKHYMKFPKKELMVHCTVTPSANFSEGGSVSLSLSLGNRILNWCNILCRGDTLSQQGLWNKGPCKAEPSMSPMLVNPTALV